MWQFINYPRSMTLNESKIYQTFQGLLNQQDSKQFQMFKLAGLKHISERKQFLGQNRICQKKKQNKHGKYLL
jgi:hypothetical protein